MNNHKNKCTSVEIGSLWMTYMESSLSQRVLQYFVEKVTDQDIQQVTEYSLKLSGQYLHSIEDIFMSENYPVPQGFTENDVNIDSPRLFSDTFCLIYVKHMANFGLKNYATSYSYSSDKRTLNFFEEALSTTTKLQNKATTLMLNKGVYSYAPYFPYPENPSFIQDTSYMNTGIFKKNRPLNATEMRLLYANTITNILGSYLLLGFSQVTDSQEIKDHMLKGKTISDKHRDALDQKIRNENLDPPSFPFFEVTNSTTSPFSNKLMMGHVTFLGGLGVGNYGLATGQAQRADLTALFGRLMAEAGRYSKDSAALAIKNKWLEQPPQFPDQHMQ